MSNYPSMTNPTKITILRLASLLAIISSIFLIVIESEFQNSFRLFLRLFTIYSFGLVLISTFTNIKKNTVPPKFLSFYLIGLVVIGLISFNIIPQVIQDRYLELNISNQNNISVSPSQNYYIRSISDTEYLLLVTPKSSRVITSNPTMQKYTIFDQSNVAWGVNEEIVVITYVSKDPKSDNSRGVMNLISTADANIINSVDLGTGSYYGVSKDQAFPPKLSPDGKYLAVQNDLIHAISIYDTKGQLVVKSPTAFAATKLFSPEMYELDSGTYSPFLEYEWFADSKSINYKFQGGKTTYTLELAKEL